MFLALLVLLDTMHVQCWLMSISCPVSAHAMLTYLGTLMTLPGMRLSYLLKSALRLVQWGQRYWVAHYHLQQL